MPEVSRDFDVVEISDLDRAWKDIVTLVKELHEFHLPLTARELLDDWEVRQRAYFAAMLGGDALFLLAYRSGMPVAFANAHIQENQTLFKERIGFLDSMYIRPEARGEGLFSTLLHRIEGRFRSKEVEEAQLGVAAANQHAKAIWAAHGYEPLMERRRKRLR